MSSGLSSTSIDRAPGPSGSFVRGKAGYVPFWPGGLDDVLVDSNAINGLDEKSKGLRTVVPGLSRGLRLPGEAAEEHILQDIDELSDLGRSNSIVTVNSTFME